MGGKCFIKVAQVSEDQGYTTGYVQRFIYKNCIEIDLSDSLNKPYSIVSTSVEKYKTTHKNNDGIQHKDKTP